MTAIKKTKPMPKKNVGRPKSSTKDHTSAPSAERGTAAGYMRKSYLVNIDTANKMDSIAYWDRKTIKETVEEAMSHYVGAWEKKNGPVKPLGKK